MEHCVPSRGSREQSPKGPRQAAPGLWGLGWWEPSLWLACLAEPWHLICRYSWSRRDQ